MKVGSLVVCVNDAFSDPRAFIYVPFLPVKGRVYQIRKIFKKEDWYPSADNDGVGLMEIIGKIINYIGEDGTELRCETHFRASRFAEILQPIVVEEEEEDLVVIELGEGFLN